LGFSLGAGIGTLSAVHLVWKPEYETGIAAIDEQHRQLADFLQALEEAVENQKAPYDVGALLNCAVQATLFHCDEEEALLGDFGYAGLEAHRREHKDLIEEVMRLKKTFDGNAGELHPVPIRLFQRWFFDHITTSDKRAAQALMGKRLR
jgi:hemerythrin